MPRMSSGAPVPIRYTLGDIADVTAGRWPPTSSRRSRRSSASPKGPAVALQLFWREAARDQKDAIKMGRCVFERVRHEEHRVHDLHHDQTRLDTEVPQR